MLFVHLTTTSWHVGQTMSRQAMTQALSHYGINLYFTPPKQFALHWSSKGRNGQEERISDSIVLLRPPSDKGTIYRNKTLKEFQIHRQINWLKRKIQHYRKSKNEPLVLYVWHYMFLPFVEQIPHDVLIFHVYDDVFMYYKSTPKKEDVQAETRLVQNADIVVAVGEDLAKWKKINRPWIPCPGGVNLSIFKTMPSDLKQFGITLPDKRKKAGYFGRFNSKIDFPLLYEIISRGQNYIFLLAGLSGNMDEQDRELWAKILASENVYYLGARTQQELVHLYNALDVGFMPYRYKSGWSQFAIPLKFSEYLAVGKPVVSTPLLPLKKFSQLVVLADSAAGFLQAFEELIKNDSPERQEARMAFARENSWERRARMVYDEIIKKLQ